MSWMTASETDALWVQYKAGTTCATIGRVLRKHVSTSYSIVSSHGGITPRQRERADDRLSQTERESISRGLSAGSSIREMARALRRAPSTASREIARNGGPATYRALDADVRAWRRAKRPKLAHLVQWPELRTVVNEKLRANSSPAQISGWLAREYPNTMDMRVSHETIHRSLFVQARGLLKRELTTHLRTRRQMHRSNARVTPRMPAVALLMRSRSPSDRRASTIVPSRDTGRVISFLVRNTRTSRRSSNVNGVMCIWCAYPPCQYGVRRFPSLN